MSVYSKVKKEIELVGAPAFLAFAFVMVLGYGIAILALMAFAAITWIAINPFVSIITTGIVLILSLILPPQK